MQNKFLYSILSLCLTFIVSSGGAWAQSNSATPTCEYLIRAGDSLSRIAQRELGDARRWREIRDMNLGRISEGDRIVAGESLMLPCGFVKIPSDDDAPTLSQRATVEAVVIQPQSSSSTVEVPQLVYPEMIWKASAGSRLSRVLARWANDSGYYLVVRSRNDWAFEVPFEYEGDFRSALEVVVTGFSLTHVTPSITIYTNRVIVLD